MIDLLDHYLGKHFVCLGNFLKGNKVNVFIISQSGDAHVELLESKIRAVAGVKLTIINTNDFLQNHLVSTKIDLCSTTEELFVDGDKLAPTSVWYRRPASSVIKSAHNVPEIAEYIRKETDIFWTGIFSGFSASTKWINNPFDLVTSSIKTRQLLTAKNVGFHIPATLVTTNEKDALSFCSEYDWNVIAKTLGAPVVKKDGVAKNTYARRLSADKADQLKHLAVCPVVIQQYIKPKSEYRVTVIGGKVFAAELAHSTVSADWRAVDPSALKISAVELPKEVESKCVSLVESFHLNFSTMDLILSEDGHYYFLDLNPNGQWLWVDLKTKQGMAEYFVKFLCS